METSERQHGRRNAGMAIAAAVFLALYLFVPIVFVLPFAKVPHLPNWAESTLRIVFWPQGKLAQISPLYSQLLEREAAWVDQWAGISHP